MPIAVLKGTLATLMLVLAYATLPLVGTAAAFLIPLPAVYFGQADKKAAVSIVALTAASLAVILGLATVPMYLIMAAVTSLVISAGLRRHMHNGTMLTAAAGGAIAVGGIGAAAFYLSTGTTFDAIVQTGVVATTKSVMELYRKMGITGEDLQTMEQSLQVIREMTVQLYPALGVVFVALSGMATLSLLRRLKNAPTVEDFHNYRNPDILVWVIIAAGFSLLLPDETATRWGLNVLAAGLSLYLIQGLAVLAFYLDKLRIPSFLRIILYIIMAIQPYLVLATVVVGLFDLWAGFRTTRTSNL